MPRPRETPRPVSHGALASEPPGGRAELLSEVAHAFRTPLGVIAGYVELLQLRDDPAFRAEALSRIGTAAERLAGAVERLLSAIEHEREPLLRQLLDAPAPEARPAPTAPSPRLRALDGGDVKRIVIVDDDDEIRQLLLRTLPTDGFELEEARDGLEALALIRKESPDLVVLDLNMPNASGEDVLAELAQRGRRVPVIVLTADPDPGRRRIAEAHGADAFLVKPFSPLELLRVIERLLALGPRESLRDEPS